MMRTRNKVREELNKKVAKCKNTQCIETLLKIAGIYEKAYNDATYKELSELQLRQLSLVNNVMSSVDVNNLSFANMILKNIENH